ncbi:hypothetical protein [Streptomyces sp. NPDC051567]|uniref:hypothetical protein n=1 Tax=Streptomyces sp. NPDC051567 TaxID=3365660 RepID=UPI003793A91F
MTVFDTYGTNACTARELAGHLADRLGTAFTERESSYLGVYFLATLADTTRVQVQPNTIPGDEGEDDLYQDEHPGMSVLLLVTAPDTGRSHESDLSAIEGLTRLKSTRRSPTPGPVPRRTSSSCSPKPRADSDLRRPPTQPRHHPCPLAEPRTLTPGGPDRVALLDAGGCTEQSAIGEGPEPLLGGSGPSPMSAACPDLRSASGRPERGGSGRGAPPAAA